MYLYRIRYKKTGVMKYISHLDLLRTLERGARRAGVPLAFSEGYNPHPKISFAAPLPVGVEGCDEYLDMELTEQVDTSRLVNKLDSCTPEGLEFLDAVQVDKKGSSLMSLIESSSYRVVVPGPVEISREEWEQIINDFISRDEIIVKRKTKKGVKEKDIKPGIIDIKGELNEEGLVLNMILKTGSAENVRPDEVLRALAEEHLPFEKEDFKVTRTGLFITGNRPVFHASNGVG